MCAAWHRNSTGCSRKQWVSISIKYLNIYSQTAFILLSTDSMNIICVCVCVCVCVCEWVGQGGWGHRQFSVSGYKQQYKAQFWDLPQVIMTGGKKIIYVTGDSFPQIPKTLKLLYKKYILTDISNIFIWSCGPFESTCNPYRWKYCCILVHHLWKTQGVLKTLKNEIQVPTWQ